jgi:uncharacterized protein (DUF427 family)
MTMRATWNGAVLAESDDTVVVENNHYFPESSLNRDYFSGSDTTSICPWKGTASYYSVNVEGETNADAAWYYPDPKDEAEMVTDRVAFWKGVEVSSVD